MILCYCLLITIFVSVIFLYELYKVGAIHYLAAVNANPSHKKIEF